VVSIASALRCERWVVTIGERIGLHDREGRWEVLDFPLSEGPVELELPWPPVLEGADARRWELTPPRTMLIHERPVTLGTIDAGAGLGFAVAGNGLTVHGGGVTSTVSATQSFTAVRHGFATMLVLPVLGEQIISSEHVTVKVLDTISRRRRNARMLLVSYWPELSYAELERLRPVIAAVCIEHDVPVLVVTGSRLVELWQSDLAGGAYRVEPDGEVFPLDLALQPSMQARHDRFVERHEEPEAYVSMLRTMRA